MSGGMVGRWYTIGPAGPRARVVARWSPHGQVRPAAARGDGSRVRTRGAPRNVLLELVDGTRVVRSFRGLRRTRQEPPDGDCDGGAGRRY